jgi:DNA polymerase III psi subunit
MLKASHRKNSISSPPVIFLDIAPHLGSTKTPTAYQSKINGNLNNSRCSVLGPNTETPKCTSYALTEAIELEMQLSDRIKELNGESTKNLASQRYEVFKLFFSKVIEKDSIYSSILKRIKKEYDDLIISNSVNTTVDVIDKYIDEISEIKNQYSEERREKMNFKIRYEKLLKENQELSTRLLESEKRLNKLESQLACLKNIKIDHLPKDELTWQYILSENQNYCDLFSNLEKRLKSEFRREKKLVDLICALKERGYPVEEVYHEELKKKRKSRKSFSDVNVTSEDEQCDIETEPIATGPAKVLVRPSQVPPLNLKKLNNEGSSEEETPAKCEAISSSTESFKMTVDTHVEDESTYKKLYSSGSIPKLQIPTEFDTNFHSEFMSKVNEFSSSWKLLIEKENR